MEAIIFIGIQATGKSSFYKQFFSDTHIRLNLDMLKTRHRESLLLEACLAGKQSFVVDNTNPTILERQKYINAAKEKKFTVIGYYFKSNLEQALERNSARSAKACIPRAAILHTYNKLELPSMDEGFDKLFYVRTDNENLFSVDEWIDNEKNRLPNGDNS